MTRQSRISLRVLIVALASGPLGPSIQLATSEKTLRVVQSIQRSVAEVPSQLQQLGIAVQDLRNVIPTSGFAQRAQVATMADGVVAQSGSIQLALALLGLPTENLTAIEVDTALAPPSLPDFYVVRDSVRAGIDSPLAKQPVLAITGYPACRQDICAGRLPQVDGRPCDGFRSLPT